MNSIEESFLKRAIELSSSFRDDKNCTPFGAIVVLNDKIIGEGISSVVSKKDVTAHAEVEALRDACQRMDNHLLTGAVVYCSGFPCPFCLMACRWAEISQIVYAADLKDSAAVGFEDQMFYEQLKRGPQEVIRIVQGDTNNALKAAEILYEWKDMWEK